MNETLIFVLITCLGVAVQSFAGFAGALTAVPLFALFLSPKQAIPAYSLVLLFINFWLLFETRQHVQFTRVKTLLIGGCVGVPIGAFGLKHLPVQAISVAISLVTFTFALLLLMKVRIQLKENTRTQLFVGLFSGLLGGSVAQPGPPIIVYSLARGWEKNIFRATSLSYFTCLCVLALVSYWQLGLVSQNTLTAASITIIPAFLVAHAGVLLKNRANEVSFRQVILVTVLAVSLLNVSKYVWAH